MASTSHRLVSRSRKGGSSADTGGYSKARKRLPLSMLKPLLKQTAVPTEVKLEQRCGQRVKAYDGTTVT